MTTHGEAWIERLGDLARASAPAALPPDEEDALLRAAMERARLRAARRRRVKHGVALAAAAAVLLAAGAMLASRGEESAVAAATTGAAAEPLRGRGAPAEGGDGDPAVSMELPSGDRVTATPGAHFDIEPSTTRARRVALRRGTLVFDVARLESGETFDVTTPHLEATVLGTVFSVETTERASTVRVFEGSVRVRRSDGSTEVVTASHRLASDRGLVEPLDDAGPLAADAWRAAAERAGAGDGSRVTGTGAGTDMGTGDGSRVTGTGTGAGDGRRVTGAGAGEGEGAGTGSGTGAVTGSGTGAVTGSGTGEGARARGRLRAATAREWIAGGEARRALAAARAREGGEWRVVEADALRALRELARAADTYERAALELDGSAAAQAGYLAASIRLLELHDPGGALAALERSAADAEGSPLEERALVLRARALHRLHRLDEARAIAHRYLTRFPAGGMSEWMRALLDEAPR